MFDNENEGLGRYLVAKHFLVFYFTIAKLENQKWFGVEADNYGNELQFSRFRECLEECQFVYSPRGHSTKSEMVQGDGVNRLGWVGRYRRSDEVGL